MHTTHHLVSISYINAVNNEYATIWDNVRVSYNSGFTPGIWDLSKVYIPELLERVSAGEVFEANNNLSICINFTVFSFLMAYNNINVGGLFGCNFTFCVPNQQL